MRSKKKYWIDKNETNYLLFLQSRINFVNEYEKI